MSGIVVTRAAMSVQLPPAAMSSQSSEAWDLGQKRATLVRIRGKSDTRDIDAEDRSARSSSRPKGAANLPIGKTEALTTIQRLSVRLKLILHLCPNLYTYRCLLCLASLHLDQAKRNHFQSGCHFYQAVDIKHQFQTKIALICQIVVLERNAEFRR
jgi:hypothetical protein